MMLKLPHYTIEHLAANYPNRTDHNLLSGPYTPVYLAEHELGRLRAEVSELRKDAERYRWLRVKSLERDGPGEDFYTKKQRWSVSWEMGGTGYSFREKVLDEEIDSAIASEKS